MKPTLLVAIHGILTRQTDSSWPDRLEEWFRGKSSLVMVLTKKYSAGPFPRWNCWVENPRVARALAGEIFHRLTAESPSISKEVNPPAIWFVAHSNGACIALLTVAELVARKLPVAGIILTGAACEADLQKNRVAGWLRDGMLGCALAFCSAQDELLCGDPMHDGARSLIQKMVHFIWGKLLWPYGFLGRTGWLLQKMEISSGIWNQSSFRDTPQPRVEWFAGGHSAYFEPEQIEATFEKIRGYIESPARTGFPPPSPVRLTVATPGNKTDRSLRLDP